MRIATHVLAVLSLILTFASLASATSILGPKECIIEDGKKFSFSQGFTADPNAPSKIILTKFSASGDYKGGKLRLNNKIYRLKRFLRGDRIVIERDIQLEEVNKLKLVFKGAMGAALSLEIIQELPPTASLRSSPDLIVKGESSELSWETENSDECYLTPDIGRVDCNGSLLVTPSETTEYSLTAVNTVLDLETVSSTTVGVTLVVPSATLTAEPGQIERGQGSTLTWTSTNADDCEITPDIGKVECNGTRDVAPLVPTNYFFTARNTASGTTDTAIAAIQVQVTIPTTSLSATPAEIEPGQNSVLTWSSEDADVCSITPGIGSVECNGSMVVTPLGNTLYTFSAGNSLSGTATIATAGVEVGAVMVVPSASLTASPEEIILGESTQLEWATTDADDCSITPGVGPVSCNGTLIVFPQSTTNYILSATNSSSGMIASAIAQVSVQ